MLKLKEKREAMSLTQKQVAEQIGIAVSAYQRYERGAAIPNAKMAVRIAKALKTTVEDIYGDALSLPLK